MYQVEPGSLAEYLGITPGDRIVSVSGHILRDEIDFRFYSAAEHITLDVQKQDGTRQRFEIEKDPDDLMGVSFVNPVFDSIRTCNNSCCFCFISQLPPGMRRPLYVRDDDYRLSFLFGNFISLTNLTEDDWKRIEEQRLSVPEMLLLLAAGAGFAQYANVLVAILQNWISSSYGETMTKITSGKSLFMMIFWMGIVAPIAEEMIFRWLIYLRLRDHFSVLFSAVISAAFFGIYHGNVLQAVYAFVLGGIFAWFLEMGGNKWTSVLMHIGANTWILIFSEYAQTLVEKAGAGSLLMIYGVFAATMIVGYQYFARRGEKRGYRAV